MTIRKYEIEKTFNPAILKTFEYYTTPCPIKEDIFEHKKSIVEDWQ
jgi:hypothetical protein